MVAWNFYNSLKEIFYPKRESLTQEQINYILSGFKDSILRDYQIIYSPRYIKMTLDRKSRNFYSKDLESKVTKGNQSYLQKIRKDFKTNMINMRVKSLHNLNKINSRLIETYRQGLNDVKNISVLEKNDGSVVFRFAS